MSTRSTERGSARQRLLNAADQLFYEEGVHTVGIDRVIGRAGVAKATLYSAFGSKDELIRAYLTRRSESRKAHILGVLAERYHTPREKLLGVFEVQRESFARADYHGCAFINASAESSQDSASGEAAAEHRAWRCALFAELARDLGVTDPDTLAEQLDLLYDGSSVRAQFEPDPRIADTARAAAAVLIDAATPAG